MSRTPEHFVGALREPLVQYNDLPVAPEIGEPFRVPQELLHNCLLFARELCQKKSFRALAFTQIAQPILMELGFTPDIPPRIIFLTDNPHDEGYLVINPRYELPEHNSSRPVVEGCGSIDFAKPYYVIGRPTEQIQTGYLWDDRRLSQFRRRPSNINRDALLHETKHLDGKTALDQIEDFLDIRDPEVLALIARYYSRYYTENFTKTPIHNLQDFLHDGSRFGFITPQDGRLILVSAYGTYMGEF